DEQQRKTARATEYHPGRPADECPGRRCARHSLRIRRLVVRVSPSAPRVSQVATLTSAYVVSAITVQVVNDTRPLRPGSSLLRGEFHTWGQRIHAGEHRRK